MNQALIDLGVPFNQGTIHPWDSDTTRTLLDGFSNPDPTDFYRFTRDDKVTNAGAIGVGNQFPRPHNPDTFILISAGFDGLYGTEDDVANFTE